MRKGGKAEMIIGMILMLLVIMPVSVHSLIHLEAHKMAQFDLKDRSYGSRLTEVNFGAASQNHPANTLVRKLVLVPLKEATLPKIQELFTLNIGGVLFILPDDVSELTPEEKQAWYECEQYLKTQEFKFAVYFTYENEELKSIYEDLSQNPPQGILSIRTGHQITIGGPEAKKIKEIKISNLHAILRGKKRDDQKVSTIAITAHYDLFSVAPGIGSGADGNGSGVVGILELARIFSKLYNSEKTQGKYNLLFIFTGAGQLNFEGTKEWIGAADSKLVESISFVLCLDTLAGTEQSNEIYLHVSKPPKEGNQLFDFISVLEDVSKDKGYALKTIHKKINLGEMNVPWEHEQFSKQKILAATLSSLSTAASPFHRTTLLDQKVNSTELQKRIQLVGTALFKYIYDLQNQEIELFNSEEANQVQQAYLQSWLSYLVHQPRSAFAPTDKILSDLEKEISHSTDEQVKKSFRLDDREITIYDSSNQAKKMDIFETKPPLFDILFSLTILAYSAGIYIFLVGVNSAKKTVLGLINPK